MISDNQKKLSQEDIDILSGKKTPKINQSDIDALMGKSVSRVNPAASPADTLNVEVGAKGSIADKMNNPGNLTFAGQPGATQDGQWAKFESAYEGFNALKRDINAKKKRGYTLGEALTLYSKPAGGEVDSNYLNNIAKQLKVSLDAPFGDMDTHDVAEAVAKFESGTKVEKINATPDFSGKYLGNIIDTAVKEGKKVSLPKPPATESLKQQFSPEEKAMLDSATGNVDKWYNERGGLTPQKKMDEFSRRIKEVTSKYEQDVLYVEKQEELDQINSKFTEEAKAIANELGLETTEDGSIKPYDNEMNQYLGRLESELGFEAKARQGKLDSYMNDFMDRLAAGTHRFTANMVDLAGFLTGANMFEGFKNLSEGQRYRADQFVQQSQRYDKTIEELAKNGDVKEAAGLAVMSAVESLPAMIPMFLNPEYGIYAMGAGAAMERYRGIENENIPQWQKILDAVSNGANEMIWEKAVTVPILAKSKQAMMSLGRKKGQEVVRASVEASLKNSAYKAGGSLPSWVAEGLSEVATGVSNDIADKIYVDPNTQIGSHAFDDMVVGAVMGKAFSTPSDVATFLNKNDQRKLINKVLKSVPKDLGYEPYMNLVEVLSEREALTEMENNLATEFKGKYTPRIVELTDKANKIISEAGGKTVGTIEADNGMQAKVDYLIGQGVKIPDGTTTEGVDQLWKETKQKETETSPTSETIKTKESEKLTETQPQNVDTQINNVSEVSPKLTKTGIVEKVGEQKVETMTGNELVYRVIPEKKFTEEQTDEIKVQDKSGAEYDAKIYYGKNDESVEDMGENMITVEVNDKNGNRVAYADFIINNDGNARALNASTNEEFRNKGLNKAIYDTVENMGIGIVKSDKALEGQALIWKNRKETDTRQKALQQQESEVQNAEEIARQVSPTVPQEGTEGGGIEQRSVWNTPENKKDFKDTIVDKLSSFKQRIDEKDFPTVLEVVEAVFPRELAVKYKNLYELATRVGLIVDPASKEVPTGMVASFGGSSINVNPATALKEHENWQDFADTLNHEIVHGLLSKGVRENYNLHSELAPVFEKALKEFDNAPDNVKQILSYISDTAKEFKETDFTQEGVYTGSLEELITYAFTDENFAKFLDSIPATKGVSAEKRSIFDELKDIIRKFFTTTVKDPTALDEINEVLNKYFDTAWQEQSWKERNEKYWQKPTELSKEKTTTKKKKDVTGRNVRNGRDGNGQEVRTEQEQTGRVDSKVQEDKPIEERKETPEGDTPEKSVRGKILFQSGKAKIVVNKFYEDVKSLLTDKLSKIKVKKIIDKKQKELDKEMKDVVKPMLAKIDRDGNMVEFAIRGEKPKRYFVKKKSDGTYSVVSLWDRKKPKAGQKIGDPLPVTNVKLKGGILKQYIAQVNEENKKIFDEIEERYSKELEAEIKAELGKYKAERDAALPEAEKAPYREDEEVTEPIEEGKKTNMKMPSQEFDTKETVSVRQTILKEIAMLQKVAKEVVKNVETNFKDATKSVTDKLRDAVNKKHITDGQYRGIMARLSAITVSERANKQGKKMSDKRLEDLNDYVAKVLEKADYKDALLKAKKLIKDVSDKNKRDKSIFGDAKKLADDFTKIDPKQMTLEEIEEFNKFAEKILSYRKVPNIASLEAAVNQFGDKTKIEEDAFMQKLEDAVTAAELGAPDALDTIREEYDEYVKGITTELDEDGNEVKIRIDTVSKYMTARRKAAVARRKLGKMLDGEVISEAEAEAYWEKITPEENGELEQMLAEFKKEYAQSVKEATESKETKDAINNLTEQEQEAVRELMAAKQDQIERLSISEIEAFDNIVKNLQLGYLTPEVFQLRRKLNAMNKVDTMLGGFVEKILTPKNLARLKKIAGDKAVTNLTRWIDGMKTYRLDEMLGNTNRYKTINAAAGSAISKAAQRESNLNEYFQKKRLAINKIIDRKFSTSVGETLLASKMGRKIGKLMGKDMKFTNAYNKMREFTNFLIERSYQQEEIFKNGKLSEETHSRLAAQFIIDPRDRAKDNVAEFHNDQMLYERQLAEAKELGLTKEVSWKDKDGNIVKRDVIDTEKYEEHLRKDPEMAKLIDMVDTYFEEVKPYAKVATMENGRTFIGKQLYFPFRGKESGREANEEDIKKHLEHTNQYPKMQANATHARKGSDMWLDNDIMKVMEYHTKEVMRNYFVYPEVRATMEALEKSFTGNMEARKGELSKEEKETAMALRDSLKDTFKKRVAKYYNSGKYSVDYNKWLDPLLKAGKQGMLLNPIRPLAEIPANVLRATIATGYIPKKTLMMSKKDKAVMDALFNDYMGDRYWSAYSSELGAVSAKRLAMKKIQDMADWFIMISDKAVGRPLLRNEFLVSFKELTGQEFDVQKFSEDVDYRTEYKDQIHQSAAWAVKRVEELFNEKSPLSSALLTNFVGGAIKANPQKTTTKIFDILQSFSRNEVEQLRTAAARRNDPDMGYMVARDVTAVMLSNVTYQILRRGLGVAFSVGMAQLLGQALSDYEEEQKKELLSDDAFWRDLRRSAQGLMMGGSANIYSLAFRVGYYVVNNADILDEDQKKFVEETMIEDLYASKIGKVGTPKGILMSVLPVPSTMTKDAFNTLDGFSALLSAVFKSDATEEQKLQIFNLINMGIKYSMPNLISPVIQKSLERKINEEKRSSKETTDGENTSSIWADEDTETTATEENTSSIWTED